MKITIRHPDHTANSGDWTKWRLTYEGGRTFVETYLEKFSSREDDEDFQARTRMTAVPAFAKAAVNDIKNAIFQRIADVIRKGGPESYQNAVEGLGTGVDRRGSSMNAYIGRVILPELLTMKRVGVFVDRERVNSPVTQGDSLAAPYIYIYRAEDILSWTYDENNKFKALFLRDINYKRNEFDLPESGTDETFRVLNLLEGRVVVTILDSNGNVTSTQKLELTEIPFAMFELTDSLLRDVADYQIALMNMSSSDIAYCLKANYPFYTEQRDPNRDGSHLKRSQVAAQALVDAVNKGGAATGGVDPLATAQAEESSTDDEIRAGAVHGRAYGKGFDRPGFISPSTEPLMASMEKQAQMKEEIRILVNLNLSSVKPKMASAESKGMDERGLEAGLSYIGLELEHGEKQIAKFWSQYEGATQVAHVAYPDRYDLKSDTEILAQAEKLEERMMASPSETYRREIAKQIASLMLSGKIPAQLLGTIHDEIEQAEILVTDVETVRMLMESAVLDSKGAALAFSIPENRVALAEKDHAARAARILAAQSKGEGSQGKNPGARGVSDLDSSTNSGSTERKEASDSTLDTEGSSKVRGKGK